MDSEPKYVATFAERLKEAMEIRDKKQVDLVNESGIDKGSLSSYISGRYEPKNKALGKLATALNVDEAWLWGYDVPMERKINNKSYEQIDRENKDAQQILNALDSNKDFARVAMRAMNDNDFLELCKTLCNLNSSQILGVREMLNTFIK